MDSENKITNGQHGQSPPGQDSQPPSVENFQDLADSQPVGGNPPVAGSQPVADPNCFTIVVKKMFWGGKAQLNKKEKAEMDFLANNPEAQIAFANFVRVIQAKRSSFLQQQREAHEAAEAAKVAEANRLATAKAAEKKLKDDAEEAAKAQRLKKKEEEEAAKLKRQQELKAKKLKKQTDAQELQKHNLIVLRQLKTENPSFVVWLQQQTASKNSSIPATLEEVATKSSVDVDELHKQWTEVTKEAPVNLTMASIKQVKGAYFCLTNGVAGDKLTGIRAIENWCSEITAMLFLMDDEEACPDGDYFWKIATENTANVDYPYSVAKKLYEERALAEQRLTDDFPDQLKNILDAAKAAEVLWESVDLVGFLRMLSIHPETTARCIALFDAMGVNISLVNWTAFDASANLKLKLAPVLDQLLSLAAEIRVEEAQAAKSDRVRLAVVGTFLRVVTSSNVGDLSPLMFLNGEALVEVLNLFFASASADHRFPNTDGCLLQALGSDVRREEVLYPPAEAQAPTPDTVLQRMCEILQTFTGQPSTPVNCSLKSQIQLLELFQPILTGFDSTIEHHKELGRVIRMSKPMLDAVRKGVSAMLACIHDEPNNKRKMGTVCFVLALQAKTQVELEESSQIKKQVAVLRSKPKDGAKFKDSGGEEIIEDAESDESEEEGGEFETEEELLADQASDILDDVLVMLQRADGVDLEAVLTALVDYVKTVQQLLPLLQAHIVEETHMSEEEETAAAKTEASATEAIENWQAMAIRVFNMVMENNPDATFTNTALIATPGTAENRFFMPVANFSYWEETYRQALDTYNNHPKDQRDSEMMIQALAKNMVLTPSGPEMLTQYGNYSATNDKLPVSVLFSGSRQLLQKVIHASTEANISQIENPTTEEVALIDVTFPAAKLLVIATNRTLGPDTFMVCLKPHVEKLVDAGYYPVAAETKPGSNKRPNPEPAILPGPKKAMMHREEDEDEDEVCVIITDNNDAETEQNKPGNPVQPASNTTVEQPQVTAQTESAVHNVAVRRNGKRKQPPTPEVAEPTSRPEVAEPTSNAKGDEKHRIDAVLDLNEDELQTYLSELDPKIRPKQEIIEKLHEEEVNGSAFVELTQTDLLEMKFKRGPTKNLMKIIQGLKPKPSGGNDDVCALE